MRRYRITVDVTETYKIIVDAYNEEEACDAVYDMSVDDILTDGDYVGDSTVDIESVEEIQFIKEDYDEED